MDKSKIILTIRTKVVLLIAVLCLFPFISSGLALGLGIIISLIPGEKSSIEKSSISSKLLQASVVLMGFGMNFDQIMETNQVGFKITVFSVISTILIGIVLGKIFKVEKKTAYLIACGTAICGGSAIAAISPVIQAKNNQISFAMGVVFILNAVALFLFPFLGHLFGIDQEHFGYWAAIAIHDTSSVVGAGSAYGERALEIATTVKLTRALWIIPVAFITSLFYKTDGKKIKIPWFILFFVIAIAISHFIPQWTTSYDHLYWLGHKGMLLALFFIGLSLSLESIKNAGLKSILLGISLWIIIATSSFYLLAC